MPGSSQCWAERGLVTTDWGSLGLFSSQGQPPANSWRDGGDRILHHQTIIHWLYSTVPGPGNQTHHHHQDTATQPTPLTHILLLTTDCQLQAPSQVYINWILMGIYFLLLFELWLSDWVSWEWQGLLSQITTPSLLILRNNSTLNRDVWTIDLNSSHRT